MIARLRGGTRVLLATGGIAVLAIAVLFAWRVGAYYRAIKRGDLSALPQFANRLTRGNFAETATENTAAIARGENPSLGPTEAPNTVVLFADFECPYSKEVFSSARTLLSNNPNIRFIYRDFPLDDIHPLAREAARAGHCADQQGKFWALHDKLYQNAPQIEPQHIRFYAEQIGLDVPAFESCLADPATEAAVAADLRDGQSAGVRGTPTFFFNGHKVEGAIPLPILKQIVESFNKK